MSGTDVALRDRDIRNLIVGYSDEFIAGLIGKKRAAFNKGIKSSAHYLSRDEWGMIVSEMAELHHPNLSAVLARLKERGFEFDTAKSRTPLIPVEMHRLELKSIGALLPYPDLWASKFPNSFASLCEAIRKVAGPGRGQAEFRVSSYFNREALAALMSEGLQLDDVSSIDAYIRVRGISDPEKLPHFIQIEHLDGAKDYLECVDERMIPIDKDLAGRIYLHAFAPEDGTVQHSIDSELGEKTEKHNS